MNEKTLGDSQQLHQSEALVFSTERPIEEIQAELDQVWQAYNESCLNYLQQRFDLSHTAGSCTFAQESMYLVGVEQANQAQANFRSAIEAVNKNGIRCFAFLNFLRSHDYWDCAIKTKIESELKQAQFKLDNTQAQMSQISQRLSAGDLKAESELNQVFLDWDVNLNRFYILQRLSSCLKQAMPLTLSEPFLKI